MCTLWGAIIIAYPFFWDSVGQYETQTIIGLYGWLTITQAFKF